MIQSSVAKKLFLPVTEQVLVFNSSLTVLVRSICDGEDVPSFQGNGSTPIFFTGKVGDNEGSDGRFFVDFGGIVSLRRTAFGISTSSGISK